MQGIPLEDMISNEDVLRLGDLLAVEMVPMNRHLQWFGHVTGRGNSVIQNILLWKWKAVSRREDPEKTGDDLYACGLHEADAFDRCKWDMLSNLRLLRENDVCCHSVAHISNLQCFWIYLLFCIYSSLMIKE